jgi:hypothetical protein
MVEISTMDKHDFIRWAFNEWINRLGLAWWDIQVHYYDDPGEIVRLFRQIDNGDVVPAFVDSNWMYGSAKISVNLPAVLAMEHHEIERMIVHELCHVLVNEMREDEIHHEERVVTQLTKTIFWAMAAAKRERDITEESEVQNETTNRPCF